MKWLFLGLLLLSAGACVHSSVYTSRVEERFPPLGQFVTVNGVEMHAIVQGSGPVMVVMIHGASANAREYLGTLAPLLGEDYTLLMVDRPGHGYSERPDDAADLGVQAELIAGVLKQLGNGQPAIIVGHSFGGAVALRLTLDHPDLVRGTVLLAPISHDWGGGGIAWFNYWGAPPVLGPVFSQLVPIVGPAQADAGIASTFAPNDVPDNYSETAGTPLLFRPPAFRANARDIMNVREELIEQSARYGDIDSPVILFSGEADTVIKPSLHKGKLVKQVPDITVIELEGVGHMPHHVVAQDIVDAIARLAGLVPAR